MRFIVLGTTEFTLSCARALLDSGCTVCALISMPEHLTPLNSADIKGFAEKKGIAYHEIEDINSPSTVELLKKFNPDFIVCSWPKIVRRDVLNIPRRFCIGDHPTCLPYNRGRHPLHWLIAMGYPGTKVSFFKMDEEVDSGSILIQVPVTIQSSDAIREVVDKINTAAYEGMRTLAKRLAEDASYEGKAQDPDKANYWRKRSVHDTVVDLRMPADVILRMVRSFSLPFPCAKLVFKESVMNVVSARVVESELSEEELKRIEPGKIMGGQGDRVWIKTDDHIVELECDAGLPQEIWSAKYIHPPTKYIVENVLRIHS